MIVRVSQRYRTLAWTGRTTTGEVMIVIKGAFQLTHNYNYGYFSLIYFNDSNVTLSNPNLLAKNGTIAFASALWFYLTP